MFKIATWNVNSLRVRLPHVLQWLQDQQPDVLALQETKLTDDNFPVTEINDVGYQVLFSGQKTYNGVATLSKTSGNLIATDFPGYTDPQRRILCASYNDVCVLNLYIPNGSEVGSEKYAYKLEWLAQLDKFTDEIMKQHSHCILLGDFNIAPADEDVHDPDEWQNKILCSDKERAAFFQLISKGLCDSFRLFSQEEKLFSWWDYRAAGFRRNRGLRIDHILASSALAKLCTSCSIDLVPRKLERPSDHAPVVAEFDIAGK